MRQLKLLPALLITFSLILGKPLIADEAIYQWTDNNGVIHFSDQKHSGAEEVNVDLSPSIEIAKPAPRQPKAEPETKQKFGIEISSPFHEETIRSNQGIMVVQGKIQPEWNSSLLMQVLIDGVATADPAPNTTFVLEGIERGEHQVQLKLFDTQGNTLASSGSTTIFMHKSSVNSPGGIDIGVTLPAE